MDQDHRGQGLKRGKGLKGLNGTVYTNRWVVLGEPFAPTCLDPSHRTVEGKRVGGPGGGIGPALDTLGFACGDVVDTDYVPVWWIGWQNGHDGSGVVYMPKWSTPRSCYWVCPHQLRPPTPDEEDEIVRFLLGAGP